MNISIDYSHLGNHYLLPSIEGSSRVEEWEKERAKELLLWHALLDVTESYNSGDGTVILASSADGRGRYNKHEHMELVQVSHSLARKLGQYGCQDVEIIEPATSSDLEAVIRDAQVANIFLLGHSTYHSWLASDKSVDWYDAGRMVDSHLKNGVFANLGCGAIHSWNFIPLGRYVVGSKGMLLGKSKEYSYTYEMDDLSCFKILN